MIFASVKNGVVIQREIGRFNQYAIPANMGIAEKHRKAWQVSEQIVDDGEFEMCPCCRRSIARRQIAIDEDDMVLSFLGSGYPLYFNFIRFSMIIIALLFITSGQYDLATNLSSSDCDDMVVQVKKQYHNGNSDSWKDPITNYCVDDLISRTSLANKRFDQSLNVLPRYFNLLSCIFIVIGIAYFRYNQMVIDNNCDIKENSPSDYTLLLKGVPKMDNPETELKEFFETKFDVKVCAVNPVYWTDKLNELTEELEKLISKKKSTEEYEKYDQLIEVNQIKTQQLCDQIKGDQNMFTGQVFVAFQYEDHKQLILREANHQLKQVIQNIFFGFLFYEQKTIEFRRTYIKVEQAPEPLDVIWEYLVHSDTRRFYVRLIGFLISSCVIISFLLFLLYISKIQSGGDQGEEVDVDIGTKTVRVVLPPQDDNFSPAALIGALFTTLINSFVVPWLSRFLVDFESYETYSQYTVSLASKLALMQFFNSAIIAFLQSTIYSRNIYSPGGLTYAQIYFFITNAFIPPIINLIDPELIWKLFKQKLFNLINYKLTQEEQNELHQYPEHQIEINYADIMTTLFITFFYAPLLPAGYVFSLIGLGLYYYAEKYVLLTRKTVRHTPSVSLSMLMTELIEYLPIIFNIGSLLFQYQLTGDVSYITIWSAGLAILCSFLPIQNAIEHWFPVEEQDETTTFEEAAPGFPTFYDQENPISKLKFSISMKASPMDEMNSNSPRET